MFKVLSTRHTHFSFPSEHCYFQASSRDHLSIDFLHNRHEQAVEKKSFRDPHCFPHPPNCESQITYGKSTNSVLDENIQNIHHVVCAPKYLDCQAVSTLMNTLS